MSSTLLLLFNHFLSEAKIQFFSKINTFLLKNLQKNIVLV